MQNVYFFNSGAGNACTASCIQADSERGKKNKNKNKNKNKGSKPVKIKCKNGTLKAKSFPSFS